MHFLWVQYTWAKPWKRKREHKYMRKKKQQNTNTNQKFTNTIQTAHISHMIHNNNRGKTDSLMCVRFVFYFGYFLSLSLFLVIWFSFIFWFSIATYFAVDECKHLQPTAITISKWLSEYEEFLVFAVLNSKWIWWKKSSMNYCVTTTVEWDPVILCQ